MTEPNGVQKSEKTKVEKAFKWLSLVGAVVATLAAGTASLLFVDHTPPVVALEQRITNELKLRADHDKAQDDLIASLKQDYDALNKRIEDLATKNPGAFASVEFDKVRDDGKATQKKVETIENALLENPEKALSIPLLRKDLESIRQTHAADIAAAIRQTDRVYDLAKWFLPLLGAMAMTLLGLALTNFFKK